MSLPSTATSTRRPLLVFFGSRRSGPCRRVEAFVDQVLQARHNHETFRRRVVDVDARPELASRFGIEEIPTIVVVEDGKEAQRVVGRVGVPQLREALAPWLR